GKSKIQNEISVPDAELCKLACGGEQVGVHFLHVFAHAIADLIHQLVHLGVRAFHDQFDAAIREVADVPANVVAEGDVLDGVAESDTLDMAGKVAGFAMGDLGRGHRADHIESLWWGKVENSARLPLFVESLEGKDSNVRLVR